ncbi:MAG TPA: ABC transporter permease [Gemmataceae bacterium]|nr:ABC transporter permease [Gemmataceae bacterium]
MTGAAQTSAPGPQRVPGNFWASRSWQALHKGLAPLANIAVLLVVWDRAVAWSGTQVFPSPGSVGEALAELAEDGRLLQFTVSSLYRVTWSFLLAILVGVPFGLMLGWFTWAHEAYNPLIQLLRPISPIAWIPLSILWFGVSETTPMFLIFLASVFPITVSATAAVKNIQLVYVRAARNFRLSRLQLFRHVILPATLPQIITGLRIALGIAWLVVVAAEMVVVNPQAGGLGYLIIDARNAGSRYDLVVAGMVLIGVIGLVLDLLIRQLEKFEEVRWGYGSK